MGYWKDKYDKQVIGKKLKVGDIINGYAYDGGHCYCYNRKVVEVTPLYVKHKWNDHEPETTSANAMFDVELTDEEFHAMFFDKAKNLMKKLRTELSESEIGCATMDNSWTEVDPYEMAAAMDYKKMEILGIHKSEYPKTSWFGHKLDILIVAKDEDGDIVHCHFDSTYIDHMEKRHKELLEENEND